MKAKKSQPAKHYGTLDDVGEVRFERILPGPIERVWAYLTEPEKRQKWFAAGDMELKPGGKLQLIFHNYTLSNQKQARLKKYDKYEGDSTTGTIIRCEPPRLLTFIWHDGPGGETEVTFELSSQDKEVLLVLTHRRLNRSGMISVSAGWHVHLAILIDILNRQDPQPFWPAFSKLEEEYKKRIPKDAGEKK